MKKAVLSILVALVMFSCAEGSKEHHDDGEVTARHPQYAQGFDILEHSSFVEILIYNPWNHSEILTRYYLVKDENVETPDDGLRVKIPVDEVAITSVTQIEFLNMLDELGSIKASCSPELIYNEELRRRNEKGEIESLGDAFHLNTERLIALNADVVFATLYNQTSAEQQVAEATVSRMVYDNEWTEATPLARAEWIKFMAAFYDKLDMADTLFAAIDSSYREACSLAASIPEECRKSVMTGGNYRGTWYMPGGKSYLGTLLNDAHAQYKNSSDTTTGSLALSFETVLHEFANVDVWIHSPAKTLSELKSLDERHTLFAPYSSGEVYGFYNRMTASGANDFWESAVAHPDVILKDLMWALYPEVMKGYEPIYIIKNEK